ICIPAVTLEMLFAIKAAQNKKSTRKSDQVSEAQRRQGILSEIKRSDLEITGVLGTVNVFLKELMDLEVGDIIKLDKPAGEMIDLVVENDVWFRGHMGVFNRKKASIIREILQQRSEPV
ncbi:MAG TPA: FliM/FliN family flagellar motor C-terminal domain-containing protein, partial [Anaerovoracaceae bacterium]|nr:FliM/FliN family flagellar motor C-terminal domain-containing protein [Anaerovoracaceae bacterium]